MTASVSLCAASYEMEVKQTRVYLGLYSKPGDGCVDRLVIWTDDWLPRKLLR